MSATPAVRKPVILLVDDTPSNLDVLREVLAADYELKAANNGEKALRIAIAEAPPDMILLDVMMPGLSGYEVCRRLKQDPQTERVPVIFVTAMHEIKDEREGFAAGGVDYIIKPISPPLLLARVKAHLALYDQERHLSGLVRERTQQIERTRMEIIRRLSRAAQFRDDANGSHVLHLSLYARCLGQALGMTDEQATLLQAAASMHDIGKIGVPDAILQKPGPLTEGEWKVMRTHPTMGASIIGKHDDALLETARVVALTHHEKWDGSGYPLGMAGDKIPLAGRIVAVCDVYDSLISERAYRGAWKESEAVDYVYEHRGSHFDPAVVLAFQKSLPLLREVAEIYPEPLRLGPG